MATQSDFWGDIAEPAIVQAPVAILREQAVLLRAKTKNVIEARVETRAYGDEIHHFFRLVVPALDYVYELFRVSHGVVELYPVMAENPPQRLETEDDFKEWLRQQLSAPKTKKIIANLLAQATT